MNAYKTVMEWHLKEKKVIREYETVGDAGPEYIGRKTLIDRLILRYNLKDKAPTERLIRLPHSREVARITCHDAAHCMQQLLTNPQIKDEDYSFFDDDPLAAPPENLDYVGDAITGDSYTGTHSILIKEPNHQLLGVIFYIDGAVTGQSSDLPVTALRMSLTWCFSRVAHQRDNMWVTLGWVPQVKVAEGRGKKIYKESLHMDADEMEMFDGEGDSVEGEDDDDEEGDGMTDIKAQDFHKMISVILESYVKLQSTGFIWDLVYKGKVYPGIHFHLFSPFIKCDTEEADSLCGKYKPRTRNINHICRYCKIPTLQADDHLAKYPTKTQTEIAKLVASATTASLKKLQQMSQHYIRNAWYDVRFSLVDGGAGIHGACPSEMLHAMLLGTFKYLREIFFKFIGDSAAVADDINGMAKVYGQKLSRQSDRTLPSTNFSKGIKSGKLMGKEYRGVLLIMAALLRCTKGRELLGTKNKFKQDHKKDDWLLLVELMLEWEAYLCEPRMLRKHVKRLGQKHRYIMYIFRKVAQRTTGMGLKIMKFHAILHMMDDILHYGVPLEHDTGANESHHKPVKHAAKMTQRNAKTFNQQTATRVFEFTAVRLAMEEIVNDNAVYRYWDKVTDSHVTETEEDDDEDMEEVHDDDQATDFVSDVTGVSDKRPKTSTTEPLKISTDGARIRVFRDEDTDEKVFKLLSRSKRKDKTTLSFDLLDFLVELQDKVIDFLPDDFLQVFTRHKRDGQIFHAHPNYRGNGPWNDWVIVDWATEGHLPCQMHCFVVLSNLPTGRNSLKYGGIDLKDGVYAVVECSVLEEDEDELRRSDLFVPFMKTVKSLDEKTGKVLD